MSLTQAQIKHLSRLTSLEGGSLDISSVVDSFEALGSVDTKKGSLSERSGANTLRLRGDAVSHDDSLPDLLLACSQQKKAAHQIVLSGIMQGE